MIKHYLLAGVLLCSTLTYGQQLPENRFVDWSTSGLQDSLPVYDTIDIAAFGFVADGQTPNDQQLGNLLADYAANPSVFHFPPGDYFFEKPIQLGAGQVIKGASATETRFVFDLTEAAHLVSIQGASTADTSLILGGIPKDSSVLTVENVALFQEGDFIKIIAEDDSLVTSSWARYSTGQICQITHIEGNYLTIQPAIRRTMAFTENPRMVRLEPVQFAGIECLSITRKDTTSEQTSNIFFDLAANCWVKGVNSENCNFSHITIQQSAHVLVSGCYFHDAFDYGGGGKGYGVVLQFITGDCLVENNVFKHLRHSMLLQAGANGNVLGYNYSIQPYWTGTNLPAISAGDLVLHGNYVYSNLLEGNVVQNIVIDDSHGINGPGNTFFRNRAELFGIFMNSNPPSSGQLFIGNEVTSTLPFTGLYVLNGDNNFEYGNNIRQTVTPANTEALTVASLYLTEPPGYFQALDMDLAGIGLPNAINSGDIPARHRFLEGQMTVCEGVDSVATGIAHRLRPGMDWQVYPNPTNGTLNLQFSDVGTGSSLISILDLSGREVYRTVSDGLHPVNLSHLQSAMYFIVVENGGQRRFRQFVLAGK